MTNFLKRLEGSAQIVARSLVGMHKKGVKVIPAGHKASYNWHEGVIYVPAYSYDEEGDARLPDAFRGTLDHEMSHVANTDTDILDEAIARWLSERTPNAARRLKSLVNVYEDCFIERRWGVQNPGSKRHLRVSGEYVIEVTGGAGPCDPTYRLKPDSPKMGLF